jgi:hypothetical protein
MMAPLSSCLPSLSSIGNITGCETSAANFFMEKNLVKFPECCAKCQGPLKREQTVDAKQRSFWRLRCRKKAQHADGKDYKTLATDGTIFKGAHVKKKDFIMFVYLWLLNTPLGKIQIMLKWSDNTVTDWNNFLIEIVGVAMTTMDNDSTMIGGYGVTVHIDESKFGKRKYHVSRLFL